MLQIQEATKEVFWSLQSREEKTGTVTPRKPRGRSATFESRSENLQALALGENKDLRLVLGYRLLLRRPQARQCIREKWKLRRPNQLLYFILRPFAWWGGATLQGSGTASDRKLSLSHTARSLAGEIYPPSIERVNVNVWEQWNINGDVHGAVALISLSKQYYSVG